MFSLVIGLCYVSTQIQACLPSRSSDNLHFTSKRNTDVYDVLVYGATPAGCAAAIAAADAGSKRVALIEPTYQIGGMMTQGGIGMRDFNTEGLFGNDASSIRQWIQLNSKHYNVTHGVYQPDMYVGLNNLLGIVLGRLSIEVYLNSFLSESPDAIKKNGTEILQITTINTKTREATSWSSMVFIDATYEGDLMRATGASWTFGREARSKYNESLAGVTSESSGQFEVNVLATWPNGTLLPGVDHAFSLNPVGSSDERVMGYSYRLCVTTNKTNQAPFPSPETGDFEYNPDDFELIRRYYNQMYLEGKTVRSLPFGFLQYRGYDKAKNDVCDSGTITPITSDAANLAKGYSNGTQATRKYIAKAHKNYVAGLIYFLLTDPSVPKNLFEKMKNWGLCKDQWPENNHWPPQFYVREAGRLVGDKVYTQNDRIPSTKLCRDDSIAVGDWSIDIHIMSRVASKDPNTGSLFARNEGQTPFDGTYKTFTFELPYSVLLPKKKELTNLLVPNCPSVSHVVFSAIREEPCLWQLGRAAGAAAALSSQQMMSVQDISVSILQKELLRQGAVVHWPKKSTCF